MQKQSEKNGQSSKVGELRSKLLKCLGEWIGVFICFKLYMTHAPRLSSLFDGGYEERFIKFLVFAGLLMAAFYAVQSAFKIKSMLQNYTRLLERSYGMRFVFPIYLGPGKDQEAFEYLSLVARNFGISTPRLGLYGAEGERGAFTIGHGLDFTVGLTRELLMRSTRSELMGVFAHELAHIVRGDIQAMNFYLALKNGVTRASLVLSAFLLFKWKAGLGGTLFGHGGLSPSFYAAAILIVLGVGYLSCALYAYQSRRREREADRHAAWALGQGPMIEALTAVAKADREELFKPANYLRAPFALKLAGDLLATITLLASHPSMKSRIKALRAMVPIKKPEEKLLREIEAALAKKQREAS